MFNLIARILFTLVCVNSATQLICAQSPEPKSRLQELKHITTVDRPGMMIFARKDLEKPDYTISFLYIGHDDGAGKLFDFYFGPPDKAKLFGVRSNSGAPIATATTVFEIISKAKEWHEIAVSNKTENVSKLIRRIGDVGFFFEYTAKDNSYLVSFGQQIGENKITPSQLVTLSDLCEFAILLDKVGGTEGQISQHLMETRHVQDRLFK